MEADRPSQLTTSASTAAHLRPLVSAVLALLAGGALRVWMLRKFFEVNEDSWIYGGIARNLLLHGRYALTDGRGVLHETLVRLPGYPLFLAACFRIFGMENYYPAACLQILLELFGCLLLALFVYRISPRASRMSSAQATLWLAVLCPFTAVYAAEPLSESLTLFCLALALWSAARFQGRPGWRSALAFTFAVTCAALLRPDGALVGVALAPAIAAVFFSKYLVTGHDSSRAESARKYDRALAPAARPLRIALVCLLLALAPFAAWTWRNWRVFHVIQPLAPRYATDPGEDTFPGFQRWVKTWSLDFVSTYQIYWNVPGGPIDVNLLPDRAFDTPAQHDETAALAAAYEANGEELSPDLDTRFARLADERIAAHPFRYYLGLPLGRVADMWLRPRVENLPIDLDWWVYKHHHVETRFSWFYAALNAFYLLLALAGLWLRPRLWQWMLAYVLLRSALLWTIEAPEARYTLECFPILFALGGIALGQACRKIQQLPKLLSS
jgi:Dolichyl-phosphate-mannose-protein mannosyltransferase